MPRTLVMLTSALSLAAAAPHRAPPPAHFSIVLAHSAHGWRAICDSGCRWREASMACNGCEVRLSSAGIVSAATPEEGRGAFAFTLDDEGSGWRARTLHGTAWIDLSYQCPRAECLARVDEMGVRGL